ncbi:transcriptional regulator [Porphyromonas canoris]|uniref:Transcriptional regulator n=1 Tax=Porphyromonas canoris TaxID=36875 RepID=A0ABR4XMK6_9PORP|nr:hydrogen peroxide-inducible genes activator [Porphyromonas canoris]KGL53435.1 transcriptional regulator [Porphyromonas canoris]KGN92871.1 transcriptional regulator [Porphyromonas canoris]
MNLQQLEYLHALKKHKHFVKAAEACNVTQPTLSAMIQKLEAELGVTLVDRAHQPIRLTAVGEKIAAKAHDVLGVIRSVEELAAEEKEGLSGSVRIGVLPTIAPFLLPRIITAQKKIAPSLNIHFIELTTGKCEQELCAGNIELAILAGDLKGDGFALHPLYYEEFIGYVSRNEPLFAEEKIKSMKVDPKTLWLLDEGHCFRNQLLRFCSLPAVKERRIDYELGGIETYMHLVEGGYGITFVPELAVSTMSKAQKELLRPFAIPRPVRPISLVHTQSYVRESIVSHLCELIRSVVPSEMHEIRVGQMLA